MVVSADSEVPGRYQSLGMVYTRKESGPVLEAYVDAAFADNAECKSTAG